jgi:hypothetical protein
MLRKAVKILYTVLAIYAVLVATHLGEFWPFSIYPMFSQAGNEWSRSLVHEVDPDIEVTDWNALLREDLPGNVFALDNIGLNQNDLANLISKNEDWSPRRMQSIRHFFGSHLDEKGFAVYRVRGRFADEDSNEVIIEFTPYFYLLPDTTKLNPKLQN